MRRSQRIIRELMELGFTVELDMPGDGFRFWRTLDPDETSLERGTQSDEAEELLEELEQITTGAAEDYDPDRDPWEPRDYNDADGVQTMRDFQ